MNNTELFELKDKIIEIVKSAAALVKDARFEITQKDNVSNIVTSSDIAVQHFLCEKLSPLVDGAGFYCEEEDMRAAEREYIWVIDPIDGTTNYARGIPECAISVALVRNKKAVIGVVYDIHKGDVFYAVAGGGAYMNGERLSVSKKRFEEGLICTAMCLYRKDLAAVCRDIIFDAYMQCNDFRRFGGAALEICYLAAGRCELYFEIRIFPWDYAAAYLVLEEAGGVLTGFDCETLTFDKPTALIGANCAQSHARLNQIVLNHLDKLSYEE